jgi:hypothetical protein
MRLVPRRRLVCALAAIGLFASACGSGRDDPAPHGPPPSADPSGFYLATSFERPVCGTYHHPGDGCEFGIEGSVRTGAFDCRTGPECLAIDRGGTTHQGALRSVPVDGGHAFVGCAFRVPAIPSAQTPFIELMQLSPGDGSQPLNPIEVRLFTADRTLSVGAFRGADEPHTTWRAPVDQWFDVVVEMQYGENVPTRLWVFGPDDRQTATLEVALTTSGGRGKATPRQKIGGVTNTSGEVTTYADDWYIAEENQGPLHIGPDGSPVGG